MGRWPRYGPERFAGLTTLEARQQIVELAKKHGLCSHYTSSGSRLFELHGNFCHAQAMDDARDLETLMAWLRKTGLER